MTNLLILFNPYYHKDVIKDHLEILLLNGKVAFGKVRSPLKNSKNEFEAELESLYQATSKENPLQLFLTDYANLFVAKVESVESALSEDILPQYYAQKNLNIERYFIITDLRELVRNDFEILRDKYLANFRTPQFNNHSYAIYGNSYQYPLLLSMKQEHNYFESKIKHCFDVYQNDEFLRIKREFITYNFGEKYINFTHPDSLDNIINAEIEYQANAKNPLYDFSSVIVRYSKTIEQEVYLLMKALFEILSKNNSEILNIPYSVQNKNFVLKDIFTHKPNLGTYIFLLKNEMIKECIRGNLSRFWYYFKSTFQNDLKFLQNLRNESMHENSKNAKDLAVIKHLRGRILGIGESGILKEIIRVRWELMEGESGG